ncbi:MAG: ABC transporter permease [Gammaproteobacteria bacterium]|nr:MAG: ABC transporter permease [Gammaproteobacteria bacterium]
MTKASFQIETQNTQSTLFLSDDWQLGEAPEADAIFAEIPADTTHLKIDTSKLGEWDSSLAILQLQIARWCEEKNIQLDTHETPQGLQQLLLLATAVPANKNSSEKKPEPFVQRLNKKLQTQWQSISASLVFIGDISLAFLQWIHGKSKTRRIDILYFVQQAGPSALGIVTLISLLVGMILAYLGSVQLRQLGAQVYVADLVSLGMVREMGALMTAVIMAGRTGAAYAAQIGTMQVNEEIDALKTMGVSSMEFLVLPRLIALVFVMPLLCIYADIIGMAGGALIAANMDVSFTQYIQQSRNAVDLVDISTGLFKSLFFGMLIAIAGCQSGLQCGRDSDAVGVATTNAVVRAIVYLVIADAAFNILYDKLGI